MNCTTPRVAQQVRKYWKNLKFLWKHSLVSRLPSKCKLWRKRSKITQKLTDIKLFWSCPTLHRFSIFLKLFCTQFYYLISYIYVHVHLYLYSFDCSCVQENFCISEFTNIWRKNWRHNFLLRYLWKLFIGQLEIIHHIKYLNKKNCFGPELSNQL